MLFTKTTQAAVLFWQCSVLVEEILCYYSLGTLAVTEELLDGVLCWVCVCWTTSNASVSLPPLCRETLVLMASTEPKDLL